MKYELLALDMDGTLLKSDKTISPMTLAAIREAIDSGAAVTLSTGRNYAELTDFPELKKILKYGILNSGAVIYDFVRDQPAATCLLKPETVRNVMKAAMKYDTMIHIHTVDNTYALGEQIDRMPEYHMAVYQPMFRKSCVPVMDILACAEEHIHEVSKICIYFRETPPRKQLRRELEGGPVELVYSEATSLEVTTPGVTKAYGLQLLCDHMGIRPEQSIVVGDSDNDLEILQVAGLAVAMGNANERVRACCDIVTEDNDHDGIVSVIRKYLLKSEN